MRKIYPFLIIIVSFFSSIFFAQEAIPELDAYKLFLDQNANLTGSELQNLYEAGRFRNQRSFSSDYLYLDSIEVKYGLTDYEKELLDQYGFMVTERLRGSSFGERFIDVYHKDLPVYVSSDAILHAFHVSYDQILKDVELGILIGSLNDLLTSMFNSMSALENNYSGNENISQNLRDVDVFLSVAIELLSGDSTPYYPENQTAVDNMISYIEEENFLEINFFSSVKRKIDFSQFKVRGHYEDNNYPQLANYFQTMMWLSRMELYLIAPQTAENEPTVEDVQRQTINSYLLAELIDLSNTYSTYKTIDETIEVFAGEQDNVKLENLNSLKNDLGFSNASSLLDGETFTSFQNTLREESYAFQRILSQVLMNDPSTPDSIVPASAFMIFGQRFVIDSYVTGNVVFDKIKRDDIFIRRMLPSSLDMLFALGNDAAAQLLAGELEEYFYAPNLAGLRYLIDNHDEEFWNLSIYNSWLNAIRSLNPPADRTTYPEFMQTAAWWQHKMNTQLAGWTELRHDNLLYAKQSYTGGITCYYPYSFVEPVPRFFEAMSLLAENSAEKMNSVPFKQTALQTRVVNYLNNFKNVADTLSVIAGKQLLGNEFSEGEKNFLSRMLSEQPMCGGLYNGWYRDLFYQTEFDDGLLKYDALVADYHTAPTDQFGAMVGWVKHAGTGWIDMAVITSSLPGGEQVAFIGPVLSYHEYTTTNFERLSDSEWKESFLDLSSRPNWVNIFLANPQGESYGPGASLLTDIEVGPASGNDLPDNYILAGNYPNPFNNGTIITYTIPQNLSAEYTELSIFSINGEKVATLVNDKLPPGTYATRWYGKNDNGALLASGIYFYRITVGSVQFVGKMNLLK